MVVKQSTDHVYEICNLEIYKMAIKYGSVVCSRLVFGIKGVRRTGKHLELANELQMEEPRSLGVLDSSASIDDAHLVCQAACQYRWDPSWKGTDSFSPSALSLTSGCGPNR